MRLRFRQNHLVYFVQLALLLCFSGGAQPPSKSSTSGSYELTVWAGYDGRFLVEDPTNFAGLKIHAFVRADAPFSLTADNGHGDHLSISGTVREIDTQDFCLTNGQLEGFGMFTDGLSCSTKQTREIRKILEPILGPDSRYHPSDPPEAETSCWWISIGPGYRVSLKRLLSSQLTILLDGGNLILKWPTNFPGYALKSTSDLGSPVWMINSTAPVVVNGQNTVTNPISGTQQFFRLSQ